MKIIKFLTLSCAFIFTIQASIGYNPEEEPIPPKEKPEWCQNLSPLRTNELKALRNFFEVTKKSQFNNDGLIPSLIIRCLRGHAIGAMMNLPEAFDAFKELDEQLFKPIRKNTSDDDEYKREIFISNLIDCINCIDQELDEREKNITQRDYYSLYRFKGWNNQ